MSRIYKQLIEDKDEARPALSPARERAYLHLLPPPANARMLAPLFKKKHRRKKALTQSLLVLGLFVLTRAYDSPQIKKTEGLVQAHVEKHLPKNQPLAIQNIDLTQQNTAIEHFKKQDYQAAKGILEKLVNDYPESVELLNQLALTHVRSNEAILAKKLFTRALKLAPSNATTLNNLGSFALAQKDWPQAVIFLTRAVNEKPELLEAHLNLGIALESTGDVMAAVPEYELYLANPKASAQVKPLLVKRLAKIKAFSTYYVKHLEAQYD